MTAENKAFHQAVSIRYGVIKPLSGIERRAEKLQLRAGGGRQLKVQKELTGLAITAMMSM